MFSSFTTSRSSRSPLLSACLVLACATPDAPAEVLRIPMRKDQELKDAAGRPESPSRRSPRRDQHPLAAMEALELDEQGRGLSLRLLDAGGRALVDNPPVPDDWLLPRLPYQPAEPADAFDAFNLMMAEFSRNGLEFAGDETSITVANNCLQAGLWEVSVADELGEVSHGWLDFPGEEYLARVAAANQLAPDFVARALGWRTEPARVEWRRLRGLVREHGAAMVEVVPGSAFRAADGEHRAKMAAGYVSCRAGNKVAPEGLDDLGRPLWFADFQAPGRYTPVPSRRMELGFLRSPRRARFREVDPWVTGPRRPGPYVEVVLELQERWLVIGNLPLRALEGGETIRIHGFGVGIPAARSLPEVRAEDPSGAAYAYLVEPRVDGQWAVNSHDVGLETLDLRWLGPRHAPQLELTLGSFERVTALISYRLDVPELLAWRI